MSDLLLDRWLYVEGDLPNVFTDLSNLIFIQTPKMRNFVKAEKMLNTRDISTNISFLSNCCNEYN
tara:strand:- start:757 stop:951 length:195 start_codon:yes stop_codon:yes gene_type:complete